MKNRVKRTVSVVTAFCLAGGIINTGITFPVKNSGVVFAEPDSSAESSSAVKRLRRQEVSVIGEVSVTNGIITLYYDSELVSVKDVDIRDELSGMTTSVNTDVPGKIVIGFASGEPKIISGDIIFVDYEYSTDIKDIPQFGIRVNELETEDENGKIIEVDKERIESQELSADLLLYNDEYVFKDTDAQGNIFFDIFLDRRLLVTVNNGEFTVTYDPEVMQFDSYEQLGNQDGVLIDINETEPGKLKGTFVSDHEIDTSEMPRLKFKPLKNAVSEIVIKTDELSCVMSEDRILTYSSESDEKSTGFGINIPGLSDSLQYNRKGTFRIGTHGDLPVTNGMFTVNYNYKELEFKEVRVSDSIKGAVVNTDVPGKIVIGFASAEPVTLNEVIADIDFAFPAGLPRSMDSCYITVNELENENEDGTVTAVDTNQIYGQSLNPEYDMVLRKADQSEEVEAVIKLEWNSGVTNGSLNFNFDPKVLEFAGVSPAAGLNGLLVDANETVPGRISCVFVSDSSVTTDGELLILKFKPLRSCWTKVEFVPGDLMNTVSEDKIYEYISLSHHWVEYFDTGVTEPVVTTSPAPVTSEAPAVTTEAGPVISEAPAVTTEAGPVISESPAVTTVAAPVISESPAVTTVAAPVISEAPVVTTVAAPVISESPAVTTVAAPVISEVPVVTTVAAPVISEAPVVTTVAAPVISEATAVTTVAAPVISEAPAVTTVAAPVISEAPAVTTEAVPVISETPVVTTPEPSVTSPVEQGTVAGDINGDDSVTSRDLITLIKMILGTEKQSASSDLNGDGKIDSADLLELKKILAK
ncbi:MAG: hypothetical protein J5864_06700 [Oscillospiraceae bacterium]|nr:hypothetical protein [Oscillospiraceae bacterium]